MSICTSQIQPDTTTVCVSLSPHFTQPSGALIQQTGISPRLSTFQFHSLSSRLSAHSNTQRITRSHSHRVLRLRTPRPHAHIPSPKVTRYAPLSSPYNPLCSLISSPQTQNNPRSLKRSPATSVIYRRRHNRKSGRAEPLVEEQERLRLEHALLVDARHNGVVEPMPAVMLVRAHKGDIMTALGRIALMLNNAV